MTMKVVTTNKLSDNFTIDQDGEIGIHASASPGNIAVIKGDGVYVPPPDSSFFKVGPGRPDNVSTTRGTLTGNEDNGTIYISTDGAGVGAYQWLKSNGSWVVTRGDTGWIGVDSPNLSDGKVYFRRTESLCMISIRGGANDAFVLKNNQPGKYTLIIRDVPVGFRPTMTVGQPITKDFTTTNGYAVLTAQEGRGRVQVRLNSVAPTALLRVNPITYVSDDVWVNNLRV